jgi:hypothetical protein
VSADDRPRQALPVTQSMDVIGSFWSFLLFVELQRIYSALRME